MNHHAEKLVHPTGAEDARDLDAALGGVVEHVHTCPGCGTGASRRARPAATTVSATRA